MCLMADDVHRWKESKYICCLGSVHFPRLYIFQYRRSTVELTVVHQPRTVNWQTWKLRREKNAVTMYVACPHKKEWMFWTAVPKLNWVPIHLSWIRFPPSAQLSNTYKESANMYIQITAKNLTTVLVRKQVDDKWILTVAVKDLIAWPKKDAVLCKD